MLFFYNIDILCMQKLSVYCMNMSFSDSPVYPKIFYFQLLLSKCTIPQQAAGDEPKYDNKECARAVTCGILLLRARTHCQDP